MPVSIELRTQILIITFIANTSILHIVKTNICNIPRGPYMYTSKAALQSIHICVLCVFSLDTPEPEVYLIK